jgi:tetratricopeptide (TPR) repeat protein
LVLIRNLGENQPAMKRSLILLSLSFLLSNSVNAQESQNLDSILNYYSQKNKKVDSLLKISRKKQDDTIKVEVLARLYNTFLYNTPLLAKRFAEKELEVSQNINYKLGVGWATYHLGAYFQNAGNNDSAKYYLKKSSSVHKELGRVINYASVINSLAHIDYTEGEYDEALLKFEKALAIYKDTSMYQYAITQGDRANIFVSKGYYKIALAETLDALRVLDTVYDKPWRMADAQRQVGYIEFLRENHENALEYFKKAAVVYKQQKDNVYLSSISNDIGNAYYYLKKNDSAEYHFNLALQLAKENNISENEGNALSNLGKLYLQENRPKKALQFLQDALKIHSGNNYKANILLTQNEIGNVYLKMGQAEKAIPFLTKTIQSATGIGPINDLKVAYKLRFQAYRQLDQLDNAIEDQMVFQQLNDSVFNEKSAQQIEELRTIYETEKKEQQIAIQQNEIALLEQEAKINNLQQIVLGGGLGLSILVFGFGYYGIRQKMKRNRLEKEKVDAELAFKRKELTTHALHLAKKNEVLEGLKQKAQELKEKEVSKNGYQQLIRTINFDLQDDNNWENFSRYFEEVHKDFNSNVKTKYPQVTSNELRLLALLKMNLSSKEIANILNISPEGIKKARYRLRKKLDITTEDSLQDLVLSL